VVVTLLLQLVHCAVDAASAGDGTLLQMCIHRFCAAFGRYGTTDVQHAATVRGASE
jgi:hypothetical protein